MHDVRRVPTPLRFSTTLWASDQATEKIAHFRTTGDPNGKIWSKILRWAQAGFQFFEGKGVNHEWEGVFRVGTVDSLFRLIGFYGEGKSEFIVIDAMQKKKTRLNASERVRIDEVARVKRLRLWRKAGE